jgi:hypothetical protein
MKTKFINIVYIINAVSYVITLILFATIVWGFFAEMALGGIQVLSSLLVLIYWNQYSKQQQKKLILYWVMVVVYFALWLVNWDFLPEGLILIVGVAGIPMAIGLYFTFLLSNLKIHKREDLIEQLGYDGA